MITSVCTLYKHCRLLLPRDQDIQEEIARIARLPVVNQRIINQRQVSENHSFEEAIKEEYEALRRAFNRKYFTECNVLYLRSYLDGALEEFNRRKRNLEFQEETVLASLTTHVEASLKGRRLLLVISL